MKLRCAIAAVMISVLYAVNGSDKPKEPVDAYYYDRLEMVRWQIQDRGIRDRNVIEAMRKVPRHELVPSELKDKAYDDHPLPIGHGQTISQPYIVALMTDVLNLEPDDTVLEIGTGSGYQAAVLAEIVKRVVTCEIVGALASRAQHNLEELGYDNVTVHHADGYWGYKADAPYDAIIVTAAAGHIPPPLLEQLKPGGIMIIPVGRTSWTQNLILVNKDKDGKTRTRNILPVRFVPLTRDKR